MNKTRDERLEGQGIGIFNVIGGELFECGVGGQNEK